MQRIALIKISVRFDMTLILIKAIRCIQQVVFSIVFILVAVYTGLVLRFEARYDLNPTSQAAAKGLMVAINTLDNISMLVTFGVSYYTFSMKQTNIRNLLQIIQDSPFLNSNSRCFRVRLIPLWQRGVS